MLVSADASHGLTDPTSSFAFGIRSASPTLLKESLEWWNGLSEKSTLASDVVRLSRAARGLPELSAQSLCSTFFENAMAVFNASA